MNLTADSSSNVATTGTSSPAVATITVTSSPTAIPSSGGSTTLVGAVVGAVLGIAFLSAMAWTLFERRKRQNVARQLDDVKVRTTAASEAIRQHKDGQLMEMSGLSNRIHELSDSRGSAAQVT
ncbi:hypothetical protein LTR70_010327 [Exophiala xenobiotica]|nr:hypothetical protein LTR70_010327 [Exophiala xenobiotica]